MGIKIRVSCPQDLSAIARVHEWAFGQEDEALLVRDLLEDPSARPLQSLVAVRDEDIVGHVLFSAAWLNDEAKRGEASLLAPLAVIPQEQGRGTGGKLVREGLAQLAAQGTRFVFVLGDPAYYSRFGFCPAMPFGLMAPYDLPEAYRDAWLVHAFDAGDLDKMAGRVRCAHAIDKPHYWQD